MTRAIDTHTHLPGRALGCSPRTAEDLRAEYEAAGLAGAWMLTVDGLIDDPRPHNDVLLNAVSDQLDFFWPFCTVAPNQGTDACLAELHRCAGLGARGLKLHGWLQAFSMTGPAIVPLLRRAGELGMPVLLHDGTPPYCSPLQIAYAAEQCPGTTIILGHAGLDDLYNDAILACRRHPNIYLCLCSLSAGAIAQVIAACPPERLLFGSDGGLVPGLAKLALNKFVDLDLAPAVQRQLFLDNALRLLPRRGPN